MPCPYKYQPENFNWYPVALDLSMVSNLRVRRRDEEHLKNRKGEAKKGKKGMKNNFTIEEEKWR